MNWVKVLYPEKRTIYIGGTALGSTNTTQFVGEDATHVFHLGEPVDYKPKSMKRRVAGTSRRAPLVLQFEPK